MHAEIWYHYAHFVRIYGIESDARYGATRAIDLSTHAAFRDKVSKEFEDILLIKDTVPYDKDAEVLPATEGN
jgi:hypothetical protein